MACTAFCDDAAIATTTIRAIQVRRISPPPKAVFWRPRVPSGNSRSEDTSAPSDGNRSGCADTTFEVKVFYDREGKTLTVWFTDRSRKLPNPFARICRLPL